jgi:hypothetical protein
MLLRSGSGERVRSEDEVAQKNGGSSKQYCVSKKGERGERVYLLAPIYSSHPHAKCSAVERVSEVVLIRTFYALPPQSNTGRCFSIQQ